jgi:hypothetical protein
MTQTLKEFLESNSVASATLRHGTRYYIAERYGDVPPSMMRSNLLSAGASTAAVQAAEKQLEGNPQLLDNACLALLSAAWVEEAERERIVGAIEEAKNKLPVIEVGIMAYVAMYAMYLAVTGGKTKVTVERKPDGSFKESTDYHDPVGPLGALIWLIRGQN